MEIKSLQNTLARYGQEELLAFYDTLDAGQKAKLIEELESIDWPMLNELIDKYVLRNPQFAIPTKLTPAPYLPLAPRDAAESEYYKNALQHGEKLLRSGKCCCLTVAGGQGTRLGYDGPKGSYPIGPVSRRSLFGYFAETIACKQEKYNIQLAWYIMTSQMNNRQTEEFFQANDYFGLSPEQVFFFVQGTMPAVNYAGKLLLSSPSELALSPDGHGGTLLALHRSGALDKMAANGVEHISYFQVDNPMAPLADPLFIGLHELCHSQMSSIMLDKTGPEEKLGNFCLDEGRLRIIEYSDLPAELAAKRNADGSLYFRSGSPAIHIIRRDFIEKLTSGGDFQLPWHRADKRVPYIDGKGDLITPESPNAVKLESFIFDALALADVTLIKEGDRMELFAPVKNASGVDSAESCRNMLIERDARRLEMAGVIVPRRADGSCDCVIEISPRLAADYEDVAHMVAKSGLKELVRGSENYFEQGGL